ncbi:MAG TPA: ABC transporter substrate-binding protein, partial [Phycisphaerae bacterium]
MQWIFRHAILLFAALLPACEGSSSGPSTSPATTTASPALRDIGPGPRIVSTVPAATLNLMLIGGDDRLVGISRFDKIFLPESEQDIPVAGDYEQVNYEQLVKLKPTVLIIQQAPSRISDRLKEFVRDHQIELLNMQFENVEDIWASAAALGKASGRSTEAQNAIQ